MQTYEILEKAKALIEDPNDWCQCAAFKTGPKGNVQHCAIGAVDAVTRADGWVYERELAVTMALDAVAIDTFHKCSLVDVNNNLGHEATIEMFNEAIRTEKAKAGIPVDLPEVKEPEYANV